MNTPPKKKHGINIRLLLSIILAGLLIYWMIPKPITVETVPVQDGILNLPLTCTGIVEGDVSSVSSRLTARIVKFPVEEGDSISKGQVLVKLESDDLGAEILRLQASEDEMMQQERSLQSLALAEKGERKARVTQSHAAMTAARKNLEVLQLGSRPEDIASQRAVVAQIQAQAEDARRSSERMQKLYAQGAVSAQQRDGAEAAAIASEAQVNAQQQNLQRLIKGPRPEEIQAAQAQFHAAKAEWQVAIASLKLNASRDRDIQAAKARLKEIRAAYKNAQAQLAFSTLRSPVSGVVVRKHKEIGEVSNPFEPVVTVASLNRIWVVAEVDAEDIAAVAKGQQVEITLDAWPGRKAIGRITRISQMAEPKDVGRVRAKIVRARIQLISSEIPLKPGLEVNITGTLPVERKTVLVPNDAVTRIGNKDCVYVVQNGRAYSKEVILGQSNFTHTQVLSGLKIRQLVAINHLDKLTNSAKVRVRK